MSRHTNRDYTKLSFEEIVLMIRELECDIKAIIVGDKMMWEITYNNEFIKAYNTDEQLRWCRNEILKGKSYLKERTRSKIYYQKNKERLLKMNKQYKERAKSSKGNDSRRRCNKVSDMKDIALVDYLVECCFKYDLGYIKARSEIKKRLAEKENK